MSDQERLDAMLAIAVWEMIFGGGRTSYWSEKIASLLARGAVWRGVSVHD